MQIIFKRDIAESMKDKYLVLELETIEVGDDKIEAFMVVPPEAVVLNMTTISEDVANHESLIDAMKKDDVSECIRLIALLKGSFNKEADSFYEIIEQRCNETGSCKRL